MYSPSPDPLVLRSHNSSRRPVDSTAGGRNSRAFTKLKMVVLAPIPSANVSMAPAANPGFRVRERKLDFSISLDRAFPMPV